MRGKVRLKFAQRGKYGITPAYAGKSEIGEAFRCEVQDHPRVCGEKIVRGLTENEKKGSPPRMRGKVYL